MRRYQAATLFLLSAALVLPARAGAIAPGWLELRPGQVARVGAAPWPMTEPEAALSGSEDSAAKNPDDYAVRPSDAIHEPIGLRVVIERVYDDKVVRVRPDGVAWSAYTRLDQLAPEVPVGTDLVVAGGFGNYGDFYPALETPARGAIELVTGTPIVALKMGTAVYDPEGSDFVRVKVLVKAGKMRGRVGWIPVLYTGLPGAGGTPLSTTESACRCRLLEFR
jgi:hypothetical protein